MGIKEELSNIKALDVVELEAHLLVLLKEQFELRMQHKGGQLTDISKLGKTTKSIARVKTVIKEKQLLELAKSTG